MKCPDGVRKRSRDLHYLNYEAPLFKKKIGLFWSEHVLFLASFLRYATSKASDYRKLGPFPALPGTHGGEQASPD